MRFELMWKDQNSGKDGCPALYATDSDYYGVVGRIPDPTTWDCRDDDATVLVPLNVLDRLPSRGDCQRPFEAEGGHYLVVGRAVDASPSLTGGVAWDEDHGLVPREVLDRRRPRA